MTMESVHAKKTLRETNVRTVSQDSSNTPIVQVKFKKCAYVGFFKKASHPFYAFQNAYVLKMEQLIVHVMIVVNVPVRTKQPETNVTNACLDITTFPLVKVSNQAETPQNKSSM